MTDVFPLRPRVSPEYALAVAVALAHGAGLGKFETPGRREAWTSPRKLYRTECGLETDVLLARRFPSLVPRALDTTEGGGGRVAPSSGETHKYKAAVAGP